MRKSDVDPTFQKSDSRVIAPAFHSVKIFARKLITAGEKIGIYLAGRAQSRPLVAKTKPAFSGVAHLVMQRQEYENITVDQIHQVYNQFRASRPAQDAYNIGHWGCKAQ